MSVAGPLSNLVLALAAALPLRYMIATGMNIPMLSTVLFIFIQINLLLMVFNLIPIPPLDGSKVLYAFLEPRTAYQVRAVLEQYGIYILLARYSCRCPAADAHRHHLNEVMTADPAPGRHLNARMRPGSTAWWLAKHGRRRHVLARVPARARRRRAC